MGKGILFEEGKKIYEGLWERDLPNGEGEEFMANGDHY